MLKKMPVTWTMLLCTLFLSWYACAEGNAVKGENKSIVCAACHGAKGVSNHPEWPSLASQNALYISKELRDFKSGARQSAIMSPLVAGLSEQDIDDLAAFYSSQPKTSTSIANTDSPRGKTLYRQGDIQRHIVACITCHGPDGGGNAEAGFPLLRNQPLFYTTQQLRAFQSGLRHNDLHGVMHDVSKHLSDDDLNAVAAYIAEMH